MDNPEKNIPINKDFLTKQTTQVNLNQLNSSAKIFLNKGFDSTLVNPNYLNSISSVAEDAAISDKNISAKSINFNPLNPIISPFDHITFPDINTSAKSINLNPLNPIISPFDHITLPDINTSAKSINLNPLNPIISPFDHITLPDINTSAKSINLNPLNPITSAFNHVALPDINISAKLINLNHLNPSTSIINNIVKPDIFSNKFDLINTPSSLVESSLRVSQDIFNVEFFSIQSSIKNIDILKHDWLDTTLTKQFKQNQVANIQEKVEQSTLAINNSYLANPNFSKSVITTYKKNNISNKDNIIEELTLKGVSQLFSDISEDEVKEFFQHLSEYPMLGLAHNVGRKIYEAIKNIEPVLVKKNPTLYHGRKRVEEQHLPYILDDLLQAPYGIPRQGRFNPSGINLFYTSTSHEAVSKELKSTETDIIDVLKFNFKNPFNILDLTKMSSPLITFCMQPSNNLNMDKSYLIPNFISQCAFSNSNIDAIKFNSIPEPKESNFIFLGISRNDIKRDFSVISSMT